MRLQIRLFARARDLLGNDQFTVELPAGATVKDLKAALEHQAPVLQPVAPHLLVAVDNRYAPDEMVLEEHAIVACFPPVSGG